MHKKKKDILVKKFGKIISAPLSSRYFLLPKKHKKLLRRFIELSTSSFEQKRLTINNYTYFYYAGWFRKTKINTSPESFLNSSLNKEN